ncbi:MAG: hypothetical protein DI537_14650 [Stutzerimonas stutzeri]|nr:MAG: hypothetical protein DI537_14650 [Stutzerimonas stutzeri]
MTVRMPQLVRDKMEPRTGIHEANIPVDQPLTVALLIGKLHSEVAELSLDLTNPEEYADVLEALSCLASLMGVSWTDIETTERRKRDHKGALLLGNLWIPEAFMPVRQAAE